VTGVVDTIAGPVPRVGAAWTWRDRLGAWRVRWGVGRDDYRVDPGLYALGDPDPDSPVLVTANYKLTFDVVRRDMVGRSAWLLVLDTRGINVWCAAGKRTFSTDEIVRWIEGARLTQVVAHQRLVVPQLGATGVAAHLVRKATGFRVMWGPVRSADLPAFLDAGMKATPRMREVTFPTGDRLVLAPVEVVGTAVYGWWAVPALFAISGFGPWLYSLSAVWHRGFAATSVFVAAALAGGLVAPLLLPWLPGRAFSIKGAVSGLLVGLGVLALWDRPLDAVTVLAVLLGMGALSSFVAMNFTGATPYTSPSGVEKEMRRSMPWQALAAAASVVLWVASAWIGKGGV
jgi:CO dehydrogenase/acetyl-CoA synthase delta subunit